MKRRSPIEAMIDEACGYNPGVESEDLMRAAVLLGLADAAEEWFAERCPIRWTEAQHIEQPEVNCNTEAGKRLARAVSAWLRIGRGKPATQLREL